MCTGSCAKCLGATLIVLAVCSLLANTLLFFPAGVVAKSNDHISREVFYLGGIIGSGVLIIFPALVFLGMKKNDCCGCCGNESCGKRFASFSSILFAAIGFVGAGYNFIISAVAINKGPICYLGKNGEEDIWDYAFADGDYLGNHTLWEKCKVFEQDKYKVNTETTITWNLTLFCMLLIMGGTQAVLCAIQAINGLIGTICGECKCCGCCGEIAVHFLTHVPTHFCSSSILVAYLQCEII
ncbi:PREDICTED: transmembrane 4 L6 family member 4-like [Nanorana parkeri]|uniref:transmembrane 4 L6 family member 4-like n=1 Tax=Nanorana parkeri TaxID=125878 RepID=UPI0008540A69|nr:PREDICTED: transmembrane 4 L6 family member 4-like [Nanorana parkeri]